MEGELASSKRVYGYEHIRSDCGLAREHDLWCEGWDRGMNGGRGGYSGGLSDSSVLRVIPADESFPHGDNHGGHMPCSPPKLNPPPPKLHRDDG